MATIEIPAQLSLPGLFQAIEQLSLEELDSLVAHAKSLRLRLASEDELLSQINQKLPNEEEKRLKLLSQKQEDESITEKERLELLQLVEKNEELDVQRVEALLALAQKRDVSINHLLKSLNLDKSFG